MCSSVDDRDFSCVASQYPSDRHRVSAAAGPTTRVHRRSETTATTGIADEKRSHSIQGHASTGEDSTHETSTSAAHMGEASTGEASASLRGPLADDPRDNSITDFHSRGYCCSEVTLSFLGYCRPVTASCSSYHDFAIQTAAGATPTAAETSAAQPHLRL